MLLHRNRQRHGVSAAWISFADLFGQLMVIGLVMALFFWYRSVQSSEKSFVVSGEVIGIGSDEWHKALFIGESREIPVQQGNKFTIDALRSGPHKFLLRIPQREDVSVAFTVHPGTFDGLRVQAGSAEENAGLVINPLTEDIVAFGTADFRLLSEGQRFLRTEFTRIGPDGRSPIERLRANTSSRIAVIGQADPRPLAGRDYTNIGLSSLRAAAVGDFLVNDLGVAPDQVMVLGLGAAEDWLPERKPRESTDTYYSRCRRILIMYSEAGNQQLLEKVRRIE